MKPKRSSKEDTHKVSSFDCCQTPDYAVVPLLPYISHRHTIWEPAAGEGRIVDFLHNNGFTTCVTDLLTGDNFFDWKESPGDCIITNPPYSIKYQWIEHCYSLNVPFALLMPLETLGAAKAQRLFSKYGIEMIVLDKRVNFYMPDKGNSGTAQFPVAWFTHGFNIGKEITYAVIDRKGEH